jgi:uncharacterized protein YbjT (DUF2867 family)
MIAKAHLSIDSSKLRAGKHVLRLLFIAPTAIRHLSLYQLPRAYCSQDTGENTMKVFAIGGAGHVGSEVVKELLQRNAEVDVLVREKGTKVSEGANAVVGDLLDPAFLEKALEGIDKVYLLNAVTPDELTQALIAYDLAKKLKVKHIVYHSVFRVDHFKDVPHFASKFAVESALHTFDLPFTIIRPNYFNQNDLGLKNPLMKAGIYPMPLGPVGVSTVDVRDIAEAAAIALTTAGHEGMTYNLNGPDIVSGPGAAAIWSEVLGKEIKYAGHDMDAFEKQMRDKSPA